MASLFPGGIDAFPTNHQDNAGEVIHAFTVNDLADAVNKVETELGVNPDLIRHYNAMARVFGAKAWTIDPNNAGAQYQTTTGYLHGVPIVLQKNDVINTIAPYFYTAGAGATHCQFGLANSSLTRVAVTADTSAAAQVLGWSPLNLTAPYTVPATGLYYVQDVITATTMPFWVSSTAIGTGSGQHRMPAAIGQKFYSWQDTTGFTTIPLNPTSASAGAHMHLFLVY